MKIAYVCYNIQEKYITSTVKDEDALLLDFLKKKGLDIHREVWTDEAINWPKYNLVLIKAPWDYHDNIATFYGWLDKLKNMSIPLLNPYEIIKWNSDKHYLQDISDSGLSIIPTLFIEKNTTIGSTIFDQLSSGKLIIKPCISGGAKNTFVLTPDNFDLHQKNLNDLLKKEAFILQPFIKEIKTSGEWSFLFFDGAYSHSIIKKPRSGDFRVQHAHGGTIHTTEASPFQIETAKIFVNHFAKGCLYARVDGIMVNNKFLLMELELLEPFLFLSYHPKGFDNYYSALLKFMSQIHSNSTSSLQKTNS
jgi:glutathione synthase/RimK-type ligase-like ATP-grasp enzyme